MIWPNPEWSFKSESNPHELIYWLRFLGWSLPKRGRTDSPLNLDGIELCVIGRSDLIVNKRACGRPKEIAGRRNS